MVSPAQIHALELREISNLRPQDSSKNITLLVDGAATRLAITDALKSFSTDDNIEKDKSAIIIFFAGHGAFSKAPNFSEAANRRVEQLCPVDIGEGLPDCPDHPRRIEGIPDSTIRVLLDNISKAKGNNTTLILDCCHSGGLNRVARQDKNWTARFIEDPPPISGSFDVDLFSSFPSGSGPGSRSLEISTEFKGMANESHILLAACSSHEYAYEGAFGLAGNFTTALLKVLRAHSVQKLTYRSLWDRLVMPQNGPSQTPQCEGKFRGRRLFDCQTDGADWEDILCWRRWDRSNKSVSFILEAGDQHGVAVGSEYQIFEHDLLDDPSAVFEIAKVTSTLPSRSLLELVANPANRQASSAPNTTIAHAPNQSEGLRRYYARLSKDVGVPLRVYCHDQAYIQSVVNAGDKGPITVVDEPNEADLVVRLDEGKVKFEHAPHTRVIEPAIVARGMSMSMSGTVPDTSESSLRCARNVLDSYGRFLKHLKRTESPPVGEDILQLSFRRLKKSIIGDYRKDGDNLLNGNSVTIIPDHESRYGLELKNLTGQPLFVHVFFFYPKTAEIKLWYRPPYGPPQGTGFVDTVRPNSLDTELEPDGTLHLGYGNGRVPPLHFQPKAHVDVSMLKIFASTEPTDMTYLVQPSPFNEAPMEGLSLLRNTQSEAQFAEASLEVPSGASSRELGWTNMEMMNGTDSPPFWMTQSITFIEDSSPAWWARISYVLFGMIRPVKWLLYGGWSSTSA
ncbi:hypothetical protein BDZ89DRAFT_1169378 [Hymenopellis radicata]|nr:hypothetical protein BDZ89DRAFT_1169378 [Hymenopellis radicata]